MTPSSQSSGPIRAPWSSGQELALLAWQADGRVHQLTCPEHSDTALDVDKSHLSCPICDYTQDWAPAIVMRMALP